jgi:hypothetical protein
VAVPPRKYQRMKLELAYDTGFALLGAMSMMPKPKDAVVGPCAKP